MVDTALGSKDLQDWVRHPWQSVVLLNVLSMKTEPAARSHLSLWEDPVTEASYKDTVTRMSDQRGGKSLTSSWIPNA